MKITGGYYLKARKVQSSAIAHAPPHVREIWDWLLMQANHKDNDICNRGQCYRTYRDIQDGLSWFIGYRKMTYKKHHCEKAMKWLKKATMVTTTKTTRGMLITILNYDTYQTPENYESYRKGGSKATMELQRVATINKNDKNVKKKDILSGKQIPYSEIVNYLNSKCGKSYKSTSKNTRRHIKARFNEGFTISDFKNVIDGRCKQWGSDPKMVDYLRPETLFGSKFESYLQTTGPVQGKRTYI